MFGSMRVVAKETLLDDSPSEPGTIRIRLGVIAIASLLLTVASLTTLVIIVAIQGADLLSVVALALAVIAFSAQLIIYIVQAAQAAADNRRSLQLHAELSALLSELRERTGRTQRSVDTINERLLSAVIDKTQAVTGSVDAETVASTYAEAYRDTPPSAASPRSESSSNLWPDALPESQAQRIHAYMSAWPAADEVSEIEQTLKELDEDDRGHLQLYATDLWRSTKPTAALGPGLLPHRALADRGLLEKVKGWKLSTLSPKGMRIARLFTATGEAPAHAEHLKHFRAEAETKAAEARAEMSRRDDSDA